MFVLHLPGNDCLQPVSHPRLIPGEPERTTIVFLHEGLGCTAMWARFPDTVARLTSHPALVYSRHGYGGSDPMPTPRSSSYLHEEATEVLPAILTGLGIDAPILIGHSDGASIALLHAAGHRVEGVVAIAPHVFVEPETRAGVAAAVARFESGELAARLALFHQDPHTVFHSWADTWRSEGFARWNIESRLSEITCPVMLLQSSNDEYGTPRQLDAISAKVAGPITRAQVDSSGHSPHLEGLSTTSRHIAEFIESLVPNPPV